MGIYKLIAALALCLALLMGCSSTTPPSALLAPAAPRALTWNLNPPVQQISVYRVYRVVGKSGVLQATVSAPPYRPSKRGTYYITAVNSRAESAPSRSVNL